MTVLLEIGLVGWLVGLVWFGLVWFGWLLGYIETVPFVVLKSWMVVKVKFGDHKENHVQF
jgi:hypothetical protein